VQDNRLPEVLLTEQQVADLMGVTTHAVKKWREKGLISFFMIGKTIRFDQEEVQAFLDRNRKTAGCSVCDHAATG
jgi:excisionase family DNA binding protein